MGHAVDAGWCRGGMSLLWSPQAQGGSVQMSGFMVHTVFGVPPSGQTRPWKAKHRWPGHEVLPRWQRDTVMVCRCCRAGGNPFARMGRAGGCSAPWGGVGKAKCLLCVLHLTGQVSEECSVTTAVVEPVSLTTRQPWRRATQVKPHRDPGRAMPGLGRV